MTFPPTRRGDVRETLHGVEVPDPYRWLEDADSPEVAAWVATQRAFGESLLADLPARAWFTEVMGRVVARPRSGLPRCRGGRWFASRNDGTLPQDVWVMADSLDALADAPVLLDPNAWSADGTDSLSTWSVSDDGALMAYAVSRGGSDWQHIRIRRLDTSEDLAGEEVVAKFTSPEWLPDNASFLYTTYDEASDARGTATAGLGAARLMLHRVGCGNDELVLTFPDDPHVMAFGEVSHDGAWLVVTLVRGTENRNRVWVHPLETRDGRTTIGEPLKVVDDPVAEFRFVRVDGDQLYLQTDLAAPMGRVVRVDLGWAARGDVEFAEVVPEGVDTLLDVAAGAGTLLLATLVDATPRVRVHGLDGVLLDELDLPAGALLGLDASPDRDVATLAVSTLDAPAASFAVDLAGAGPGVHLPVRDVTLAGAVEQVAGPYRVERRRATSADGTEVPYFLVTPDAAPLGPRPTLLWGYGGFKIPLLADYRPGWSAWLRAGGTLVIANLRGGGEFGTAWYDAGRLDHKQRVFDDTIAVAEHLVATGVTTPAQLAAHGRSNGGLLVGALLTQRPDLFAAALPAVGVLDLLRFHRFTIGSAWISDYGDPDDPHGFATALAYSPLHRVRDGVHYPPTLVLTADHDDRVVPAHSFKFAAALQHAQGGDAPVALRIESAAGHGAGKSLAMQAAEWADLLAFAAHHTGLVPGGQ